MLEAVSAGPLDVLSCELAQRVSIECRHSEDGGLQFGEQYSVAWAALNQ